VITAGGERDDRGVALQARGFVAFVAEDLSDAWRREAKPLGNGVQCHASGTRCDDLLYPLIARHVLHPPLYLQCEADRRP
jgi:hypothetical protein